MTDGWRKSSFSGGADCVEISSDNDEILVRDSKLGEDSPILRYTSDEWLAFIQGAKAGEFDFLWGANQ